jgi:TatD family-associated radical SAM protein
MNKVGESDSLWLEHEPTAQEVINEFDKWNMDELNEVVFCGFGEPTEAFEVLKEVATFVKSKFNKPIRVNTNGAGSLINGRDIAPEFKGLVDTVSISLNDPDAKKYNELVRSKFGEKSFDEMIKFAKECTKYVPNVVMTTVDTTITHEEEEQCRKICDEIGAKYRIRPWEGEGHN